MKNIDIINRLSKKTDELTQIIDHIKKNGELSELYKDLCFNKIREMYEVLLVKKEEKVAVEEEQNADSKDKEPVNNTIEQTDFDNELENLNFYQESGNEDYSDIPITENNEVDQSIENVTISTEKVSKEELIAPVEERNTEEMIQEPMQETRPDQTQEFEANIENSNDTSESEKMMETEVYSETKPEPTLFTSNDTAEKLNSDEQPISDIHTESNPNIQGLIKDMESQKESIGEKYMENNKKSLNDLLSDIKKEKDLATQMQYQPITDLKAVISLNDKIRFIKELFNSDNTVYTNFIDAINSCSDLDEAMAIINENLLWDESKESFKDFLELVYRRHLPENK